MVLAWILIRVWRDGRRWNGMDAILGRHTRTVEWNGHLQDDLNRQWLRQLLGSARPSAVLVQNGLPGAAPDWANMITVATTMMIGRLSGHISRL